MKSEVVIFDLREEREKANVRFNRQVTTFKQGRSDIWLDRPCIVNSKKTEISRWKASIDHIKKVSQILFIKPSSEDKNQIELGFYDDQKYNQLQRIQV